MNALFYEVASVTDPTEALHGLLKRASFPFSRSRPLQGEADVLIEQSFSDFGDPDALVLIRALESRTCAVFIEGKVKGSQASDWRIANEFEKFKTGLRPGQKSRSNLFTQLYYKQRLVAGLRQGGVQRLKQGLQFPAWSRKKLRKIGNNKVVEKATQQLQAHCTDVFYLAVVSDEEQRVTKFFPMLKTVPHETLAEFWDVSTYGFLTWAQVKGFCEEFQLKHTIDVLDYNDGQIYRPG
jgi:hypothetical protein